MAVFQGMHKLTEGTTDEEMQKGWGRYKEGCQTEGIKPIQVAYNLEKGFAHCYTEADSEDQVRKAHENVVVPLQGVVPVKTLS